MSQDRTTAASTAADGLWHRLFGGPLLRLPGGRTRETRRLRSAVGVSLAFHATLFAGGSLLTASGLLRSGGSVAGIEIVLETSGLATGPMRDRSYAPPRDPAERAPDPETPQDLPPPQQEPPPALDQPPAQLASLTEPEPPRLESLAEAEAPEPAPALPEVEAEAPPPSLPPLEPTVAPEEAPAVLAGEPEPIVGDDPAPLDGAPVEPPPAESQPAAPEPPAVADAPPAPLPPSLASAPALPDEPPLADAAVALPPSLAEAPTPTLSLPPEAVADPVPPAESPEPPLEGPPLEEPAPPTPSVEPEPVEPPDTALAALELPPEPTEVPAIRSFEAPEPPAQPELPPAAEPEADALEPDAPTALALPPDPPPAPELPEPEADPVGPVAWEEPFLPPRADPRIIDELTASTAQTGRADGLDTQISAILSEISCGALNAQLGPAGEVQVRGFLTSSNEQESIRDRLSALTDVAGVDDDGVLVVGTGLCDGLGVYADGTATLAPDAEVDPNLPPELQRVMTPLFGTVQGERETFAGSDYLELYVTTPDFPAHVYIDYFKPDGTVVHLNPSEFSRDAYYPVPETTIPISTMEPNGMTVPAGPPYGMGMVVTLSTNVPLFQPGSFREREEPAEDYLRELELALRELEIDPEFRSEYGYVFVEAVRDGAPIRDDAPVSAAEDTVVDTPSLY